MSLAYTWSGLGTHEEDIAKGNFVSLAQAYLGYRMPYQGARDAVLTELVSREQGFTLAGEFYANQYGFGFGAAPSNSDDYIHIERNVNTSTGILVYNRSETALADAFIHLFGGAHETTGSNVALRAQSGAQGGEVNLVASHGSSPGTLNIIEADNKSIFFYAYNTKQFEVQPTNLSVNYVSVRGGAVGSAVRIAATGLDTNINITYDAKGNLGHFFRTDAGNVIQAFIQHTANAARWLILTGAVSGGNPVLDVSAGALRLSSGTADIQWGKALIALGGGSAATLGTIGATGPATAGQNSWVRMLDSTGAACWVPAWK